MYRGVHATDAGMHGLWDVAAFAGIRDYDSWAAELLEDADIGRQIAAGRFVPLNLGSDGAMEIEVRVGSAADPAALSERERAYLVVSSEPYLLRSGGRVGVSGIEAVSSVPDAAAGEFPLPAGDHAATVHLIAWDEEPGMRTDDGPAAGALPDYVVLLNPPGPDPRYRTAVETFDRPS